MFQLTIALSDTVIWAYLFAKQERANAVFDQLKGVEPIDFTDDFGQRFYSMPANIKGFQLENYEQGRQAFAERQMHAWRCKARADSQGRADPILSAAARQAAPMVSPFPNNGMPSN